MFGIGTGVDVCTGVPYLVRLGVGTGVDIGAVVPRHSSARVRNIA